MTGESGKMDLCFLVRLFCLFFLFFQLVCSCIHLSKRHVCLRLLLFLFFFCAPYPNGSDDFCWLNSTSPLLDIRAWVSVSVIFKLMWRSMDMARTKGQRSMYSQLGDTQSRLPKSKWRLFFIHEIINFREPVSVLLFSLSFTGTVELIYGNERERQCPDYSL